MASEWVAKRLGDFLTLKRGYDLPERLREAGDIPVIASAGYTGSHSVAKVSGPGVVTGRYGTIGRVFYSEGPYWPLNTTLYVQDFKGADPLFVYYFLHSIDFESVSAKSAVPGVDRNDLHEFMVLVPSSVAEQKRIAAVLRSFDAKIRHNEGITVLLERFATRLFEQQFPDVAGDCPVAPYVDVVRGKSYKSAELVDEAEVALVSLKSVRRGGGYAVDGLKPFNGDYKPAQVVAPGEIVVAHTDLTQAADVIGKPAIVPADERFKTRVASLDLAIVRPKRSELSRLFLYHLFLTEEFRAHAYSHSNGSTVLHLAKDAIPSFEISLPDVDRVAAFERTAERVFALTESLERENIRLRAARDLLLPDLVTGVTHVDPNYDEGAPAGERLTDDELEASSPKQ